MRPNTDSVSTRGRGARRAQARRNANAAPTSHGEGPSIEGPSIGGTAQRENEQSAAPADERIEGSHDTVDRPMSRTALRKARRQRRKAAICADSVVAPAEPDPEVERSKAAADDSDDCNIGVAVEHSMSRTALKKARRQRRKASAAVAAAQDDPASK